jgi:hypothetical protein
VKLKSTVKVNDRFRHVSHAYDRAVQEALVEAAAVAAKTASNVAGARKDTGAMSDIRFGRPLPIRGRGTGYDVVVYSNPFYAQFHEHGTLGSRTRKLKQPGRRKSNPDSPGLKPLRFMSKGRSAGRKVLLARLAMHIRKVR